MDAKHIDLLYSPLEPYYAKEGAIEMPLPELEDNSEEYKVEEIRDKAVNKVRQFAGQWIRARLATECECE